MKFICYLLAMVLATMPLLGQTASLRGQVTDESGALVPSATVTLNGDSGLVRTTVTATDGSYSFAGLPPGNYTVQASAPDLRGPEPVRIVVTSGLQVMNIQLRVAVAAQQVTVESQAGPAVSTEASNNASAIVLRGADLDALSDNPDDLQADLQALAGPSAGPNGGSIFVDGFSGGQLPPKASIREIRVNQNPFSSEYDTLSYGRIGAIVSAITLDPQTLAVVDPFTTVSRIPQRRYIITPRVDYQPATTRS